MDANIRVIRAVGSEFARRKLRPFIVVYLLAASLSVLGGVWLTTVNSWWWLLAAPVIALAVAGLGVLLGIRWLIKRIAPKLTKAQKSGVNQFVDKLERVAENLQTPMFLVVFRVVRDVLWPRKEAFIKTVANDSTSLHKDLSGLIQMF